MLIENIRLIIVFVCIVFLALFILKEKQETKLNWALFYGFIWMLFALPIINYVCVQFNLWRFLINKNPIKIPYDILFMWLFFWMLPFYFFKGKYTSIMTLILLWIDVLTMPLLKKFGILELNGNWLIGEVILVIIVFLPNYLWAKFSLQKKHTAFRALMQVITMSLFLLIVIPFSVKYFEINHFEFSSFSLVWFQIIFIIAFPSLIAVIDLVNKGKGTPFPYDKTEKLVTSGVYAYIRNPIQWSFTMLFFPLSIYHQSYLLLFGSVISFAYTIGVSNSQEYEDMKNRFGKKWESYKSKTPNWYFLWKPQLYPEATIYFKRNCNQCEEIKSWFEKRNGQNLKIVYADFYENETLLQATYKTVDRKEYKSVTAIAYALEHINLGYASLGWFIRLPIINFIIQTIVDSLGFSKEDTNCEL